jgi:phenylacetate-CoA ligase
VDRVNDRDTLLLRVELSTETPGLSARIADSLREVLHVRADVEPVPAGTLAENDKKLVDRRSWT